MSVLVKFNDRNHVETTVLPTYHFQDALPSLVSFSICYMISTSVTLNWKLWQAIPKVEDSCKLYYDSLEGLKSSTLISPADLERTKKLLETFQKEEHWKNFLVRFGI